MTKKEKHYIGQIPFDLNNNQLHYPECTIYDFLEWDPKTKIGKNQDGSIIDLKNFKLEEKIFNKPILIYTNGPLCTAIVKAYNFKNNFIFHDTLVYDSYSRGRSAAYFNFIRESTGTKVTVFLKDFEEIILKMSFSKITEDFTFCKRGCNYGCCIYNK